MGLLFIKGRLELASDCTPKCSVPVNTHTHVLSEYWCSVLHVQFSHTLGYESVDVFN